MSFTCKRCGATSHNQNDEERRYCGACHSFEDQLVPVIRNSMISGTDHTLWLPVTTQQLETYVDRRGLVQDIFPHLTAPEREFIQSGITPEEWRRFVIPPDEGGTPMDPTACWQSILQFIREAQQAEPDETNRELLIEDLRSLADWLERGGFYPKLEDPV